MKEGAEEVRGVAGAAAVEVEAVGDVGEGGPGDGDGWVEATERVV